MASNKELAARYLIKNIKDFRKREVIQDFFTIPEKTKGTPTPDGQMMVETEGDMFEGKILVHDQKLYRVESFERIKPEVYKAKVRDTGIKDSPHEPILDPTDEVTIYKGEIENYQENDPLVTTVGRAYINYLLLSVPFGKTVPYINAEMNKKIVPLIKEKVLSQDITVPQFDIYEKNLNFISHSPEFVSVNLTPKSIVTNPKVPEVRAKLLKEHAEEIKRGDVIAMTKITNKLVEIDKEWLKDDISYRYLNLQAEKLFHNSRSKRLLIHGVVKKFGEKGNYNFIPTSLEDGYQQKTLAETFNEIRDGSYSRSRETALGGEVAKNLLRVFQNTRIVMENCGTKKYLPVEVTPENVKDLFYRNYIATDGTIKTITPENAKSIENKTLHMRSPLYCIAKGGYCYTCMGKVFKLTGQKALASAENEIGSTILSLSMKSMHTSGATFTTLKDLNTYVCK